MGGTTLINLDKVSVILEWRLENEGGPLAVELDIQYSSYGWYMSFWNEDISCLSLHSEDGVMDEIRLPYPAGAPNGDLLNFELHFIDIRFLLTMVEQFLSKSHYISLEDYT